MADFEDANSPTWANCRRRPGQPARRGRAHDLARHRREALLAERRDRDAGRAPARLAPRREARDASTASPVSASLFDFGLFVFHCARTLLDSGSSARTSTCRSSSRTTRRGSGTTCSRSRRRSSASAAARSARRCSSRRSSPRSRWTRSCTSSASTRPGLNAGRWDYIFSVIKKLGHREEFLLPDRGDVTMAVPFMRAYADLLVQHLPPARRVRDRRHGGVHPVAARPRGQRDRAREGARGQAARGGPGLRRDVGRASGSRARSRCPSSSASSQLDVLRDDVQPERRRAARRRARRRARSPRLACARTSASASSYIASWLNGVGAAAIHNLMEDAATAEISRSQVWQWLRHGRVSLDEVRDTIAREMEELRDVPACGRGARAVRVSRARRRLRGVPDPARVRAHRLRGAAVPKSIQLDTERLAREWESPRWLGIQRDYTRRGRAPAARLARDRAHARAPWRRAAVVAACTSCRTSPRSAR